MRVEDEKTERKKLLVEAKENGSGRKGKCVKKVRKYKKVFKIIN